MDQYRLIKASHRFDVVKEAGMLAHRHSKQVRRDSPLRINKVSHAFLPATDEAGLLGYYPLWLHRQRGYPMGSTSTCITHSRQSQHKTAKTAKSKAHSPSPHWPCSIEFCLATNNAAIPGLCADSRGRRLARGAGAPMSIKLLVIPNMMINGPGCC